MPLQRLTNLERQKIDEEYTVLVQEIEQLRAILQDRFRQMTLIKSELLDIRKRYADERRSDVVISASEFDIEDLIAEEDMVVTISHAGYTKRIPLTAYRQQHRGGRGVTGMRTKDEDFVEHLFVASTHSYILFLTDRGRCHWLKVHEVPIGTRTSRGRPVVNLVNLESGHRIAAIVPVREFDDDHYLIQVTQNGLVKKTALSAYSRPRRGGIIAMNILEDDRLTEARTTDGSHDIVLATRKGQAIRFREGDVRDTGRNAQGVRGITLGRGDAVIGMVVTKEGGGLLTVCENGHGKRTQLEDYRLIRRGGKGVINIKTTERNGDVVAVRSVVADDELIIISQQGILIRLPIRDINVIGRNTQGVKLINLEEGDRVIDVARVVLQASDEEDGSTEEDDSANEALT